ncbi:MAG TPA: translocation/assembly module TamB domain-containing protein, partial [Terriglobia bacterium]|nr:translocation/assembly module TamB domain-containing protein [Terriglobia bacterium]
DLMNLSIGRLTLSHAAFFWNDQMQPLALDTREVAILLHITRGIYYGAIASSSTTIRSSHWSSPPIKFNGRFELSPARLVFSPFAWQAPGTTGEASFTIIPHVVLEAAGSFHASAELSVLASILHAPELRAGTLQIEGVAAYQGGVISANGRAQARQVAILTPSIPSMLLGATASYTLEKNQLDLTNLLVSGWGGTLQGTLQADLQNVPVKFRLKSRLHQVRIDNLLRLPGTPPLLASPLRPASVANGDLNATWSGRGGGLHADFDLALQAPPGVPPNVLPVSGMVRGTLEDGRGLILHLADAELRTPHSSIMARGTLTQTIAPSAEEEPLALTVTTDNFEEWRHFFQSSVAPPSAIPLELKSRAEFSGQLSGSYKAPSLQGRVSMGQFRFQSWTWDRLTATVTLNPGFIQISDGRVTHEKSSFELNASAELDHWRLTPGCVVHLSAQAQHTPIEGLKAAINLDLPVGGFASGHVDLQGTTTNMAGSGSLRIDDGALAGEPFDSLSAQLRVARSIWKLQNILLKKDQGRMSGEITVEPERRFASGQLEGSGFRLADFRRLPMTASITLPKGRLDGNLSFVAHGEGTAEDFHLQSSWRIQDLSAAGTPLGEFHGTLVGEGNQLRLEGDNESPGGNLHLSAKATARGDWPMEAEGEFSSLRADPWIRAFFNREFAAAVTLGGSFRAQGPLRMPAKIDIQSHASDVAVDFPSIQWRNVQPVDVHYSGGRLALRRFVMRGPSTELEIVGAVGLTHGVALALSAEGTANATLLTVFDANLQASGRSTLHLRLTGTPDRPLMNGSMNIQDVSLGYKSLPLRFNNLQGVIQLEGERAVISSLHGTCGGGTVELSGFVTLAESPRFEVRADLSQVRMRYPPSFTSVFDGHLRLGGGIDQGQLTGDLVVNHVAINENINFISKIIESSNPMGQQPLGVNSPIASKIRLNVRVTSSPPVQLQTPNLRLVGDIDLRLQGTVADPVQVGSIHFLSGETVFRGNRYTLVRGDMNMTNPFRTQTYLDLEADTQVQNYDLTLDITGPFDRLKFAYRSDPPLSQTDIIALLALGYVQQAQAFPGLQGNPTSSVGASAILSEALSSQIGGRIQHLFGVSRIKIDPYVGMPGLGSGERVTVEEQITHGLTLTYITDTSYSQYTIVQFELNLSNNVSVLGVRDPNGVFGIEFRFRRRFK